MQTRLKSRPDEPKLAVHPPSCVTPLWGVWEMWCVLPDSILGAMGNPVVRESAKKRCASPPNRQKKTTWLDKARSIGLFDNAEGFWGIVTCTLSPSQLAPGITYYMLRRNIAPMWEHEANRRGGRWVVCFPQPKQRQGRQQEEGDAEGGRSQGGDKTKDGEPTAPPLLPQVDEAWETLCIALIGEQLPCPETEVCGAALRRTERRQEWKLSLWTRTAEDHETQMRIGRFVKDLLCLEDGALQYLPHRELMRAGVEGSRRLPPKYEL